MNWIFGPGLRIGEIAGDTRVSSFASFIDGYVVSVPAPLGLILLSTGLLGLVELRRRA